MIDKTMSSPTFPESFSAGQRSTLKSSNYTDFRIEVQATFKITREELEHILPKKAKCFLDKVSNTLSCYTIENFPPFFFRRNSPFLQHDSLKGGNKGNKSTSGQSSDEILVPTLFALWRLPQLLPSAIVPDNLCQKLSARLKPSALFSAGIMVPDLPDQFLLQASQHPRHFIELFPNQYNCHTDHINTMNRISDFDFENGTTTFLTNIPDIVAQSPLKQQPLYPSYFHNKSFDYVLRPGQLRAVYCESSPYAIGVGIVSPEANPTATYTAPYTEPLSNNYLSPWSTDNNLSPATIDHFYHKVLMGDLGGSSVQKNNKSNKKSQSICQPDPEQVAAETATVALWPNPADVIDGNRKSGPFDTNKFFIDSTPIIKIDPDQPPQSAPLSTPPSSHLLYTSLSPEKPSKLSLLQTGQILQALLTHSQTLTNQPRTPMNIIMDLCLTPTNLAQLFPDLVNYTTNGEQPSSNPNQDSDVKFNQLIIKKLHEIIIPQVGSVANHRKAADLSLLLTPSLLSDQRPLRHGTTLSILHTMNDSLSYTFRNFIPNDAVEWVKADECIVKPVAKFIMITRCVSFLLRTAWLSACVKPFIKITRPTGLPQRVFTIGDDAIKAILNKTYINKIDQADRANLKSQHGDNDDDEEDDDDDEDVEYVFEDEDNEECGQDDDPTQHSSNTPFVPTSLQQQQQSHTDLGSVGPSGICIPCYTARLEWGLQYSLLELVTSYPHQLSDVTKHIRTTSNCPSGLTHIHSRQYHESSKKQKGKKITSTDNHFTIHCTCTHCANIQPNPTTAHSPEDVIESCLCVQRPVELLIASVQDSHYTKISQLIKIAEKLSWLNTKMVKSQQTITSKGSGIDIRSDGVDKRMVAQSVTNLSQYGQCVVSKTQSLSPPPPPSSSSSLPSNSTLSGGNQIAAAVQVIQAVRYPREFRAILSQVKNFYQPLYFNLDQQADGMKNFDDLDGFEQVIQKAQQNTALGNKNYNAMVLISLYFQYLARNDINFDSNIKAAVREYINTNKLTVALRGGMIIRKDISNNDHLPPIAKQILNKMSNPQSGGINDQHIDTKSGLYFGPVTVVATKQVKNREVDEIRFDGPDQSSDCENDDGDDDDDDDDDDDGLLSAGGNKKRTHQEIKSEQKKIAKAKQADLQKQNATKKNKNIDHNTSTDVEVYLCYDKALYQALGLIPTQNYNFHEIERLISKRLVPLSTLTNLDTHLIDQLAQNTELVTYLLPLTPSQSNFATNSLHPVTQKVQDGLRLIQTNNFFHRVDLLKVVKNFALFVNFKQTANNLQQQKTTTASASTHQPKILTHFTTIRGKPVTRVVGYELFGISPKTLANDSSFNKLMAAAVMTIDVATLKKSGQQLFPASISEKCTTILQLQGDKCDDVAKHAIKQLKIEAKNVFNVATNGQMKAYSQPTGKK